MRVDDPLHLILLGIGEVGALEARPARAEQPEPTGSAAARESRPATTVLRLRGHFRHRSQEQDGGHEHSGNPGCQEHNLLLFHHCRFLRDLASSASTFCNLRRCAMRARKLTTSSARKESVKEKRPPR